MNRERCLSYLTNDNVLAFLRLLREGESNQTDSAYREIVGGTYFTGPSLSEHPRIAVQTKYGWSSAFGAYQIMAAVPGKVKTDTYDWVSRSVGPSMEPADQDIKAVFLINHRGALEDVLAGRIGAAIKKCGDEWASLPGSRYGQKTQTLENALAVYQRFGGALAQETAPRDVVPATKKEVVMAPLVIPILSAIAELIPSLGKLGFGSGSEVAQRNVAAGAMVAEKIVEATQSINLQEAAEKVQSDPAALQAAADAVKEVIGLVEAGGGGIEGARKAALSSDGDWRKVVWSFPFLLGATLIPLIYAVVLASLLKVEWLASFTDDARMMVITAVINLALGSLIGYAYGTTIGSQKKDAMLGAKQ